MRCNKNTSGFIINEVLLSLALASIALLSLLHLQWKQLAHMQQLFQTSLVKQQIYHLRLLLNRLPKVEAVAHWQAANKQLKLAIPLTDKPCGLAIHYCQKRDNNCIDECINHEK